MDIKLIKEIYGEEVEIRKLNNVKVKTPDGFKTVQYIKKNKAKGYYRVVLTNSEEIECSSNHRVLHNDGHFIYVSQLSSGTVLSGGLEVKTVEWIEKEVNLYDLLDVEGNIYLTKNGVINHNCAFIDHIEETFTAAQPTLSTGGQVMLLSTPNGMGNFFHSTWQKAEMGENSFVPIRLPWQVHPERDQVWRDKQDADLGPKAAAQECDCDFLTSGDTFFEVEDMAFYEQTYQQDPVERRGMDGNLWIWEYPDYTKTYMVSADVARGDRGDFSVFCVWDVEACSQVAEYKGQLTPRDFGATLCAIASEYNNALLVIENANVGYSAIEEVLSRGYPNLYYGDNSNMIVETAEQYAAKSDSGRLSPGFTTSGKTRPLLLAKYYDYVHQKAVVLRSKRLFNEMRTFVWKNAKAQAAEGYHDDLVMAAGIGLFVRDTALRLRSQGMDLSRAQISSFTSLNRRDPVVQTPYMQNPYEMELPGGVQEDITWLLY